MFYNLRDIDPLYGPFVYGDINWAYKYRNAEWASGVEFESIKCPINSGHQRGGRRIGDLKIVLPSNVIGDFVWTVFSECLVTDHTLELFNKAKLSGFKVKSVTVKKIKKMQKGVLVDLPRLWEIVVTGKGGDADPKSKIENIYHCDACGLNVYSSFKNGIIVNESDWDGSDFFTVNGYPKFILVTEKVKELIVKNNLINCAIIPSHELKWASTSRPEET